MYLKNPNILLSAVYTMNINCDDAEELYVDGVKQKIANSGTWNKHSLVFIPPGKKRLLAVSCNNVGGGGGLVLQLDLLGGRKVKSDKSWVCATKLVTDWFLPTTKLAAADWAPAVEMTAQNSMEGQSEWKL